MLDYFHHNKIKYTVMKLEEINDAIGLDMK